MLKLVFIIAAAVFFALDAFRVPGPLNWVSAGFCCLVIGLLIV
jgi:hypothetical protein